MKKILKAVFSLFIAGSSEINCYESEALHHFLTILNEVDRIKLNRQLLMCNVIQRSVDGHIVQFFDASDQYRKRWGDELKIEMHGKLENKYKLDFISECEGVRITVNAFIGNGYFSCLEFKVYPRQSNKKYKFSEFLSSLEPKNKRDIDR